MLLFIVNVDWFFLSHRLPIAIAAQNRGYEIGVLTSDTGKSDLIKKYGIKFIDFPLHRSYSNIFNEIKSIFFLINTIRKVKPQIVHIVGLKSIIYTSIALFFIRKKPITINAISGAGTLFTTTDKGLLQKILLKVFHICLSKKSRFIFQNEDDLTLFKSLSSKINNCIIIKGSGIDLNEFSYTLPKPTNGLLIITFIGRLLKEKGLQEFIDTAHSMYKKGYKNIQFWIVGGIDSSNPSSFTLEIINNCLISGFLEYKGHSNNIKGILTDSFVTILPSYREGLPKSLIEACAIGRPIITTNAVGCKDVVDDGLNGYLIPVKNHEDIVRKLEYLIANQDMAIKMGYNGRLKAEKEFDINSVIKKTIDFYESRE